MKPASPTGIDEKFDHRAQGVRADCFMNIVLIANGLTYRGEHSYRLIQEVSGVLSRRSIRHNVFAARSLDPSVVAEKIADPHFAHTLYDFIGPSFPSLAQRKLDKRWKSGARAASLASEYLTWKILNRSFRHDLEALPSDLLTPSTLLVVTAASQNQLAGLVGFLRSREPETLPTVVCHLMFTPDWAPWGYAAVYGDAYYRRVLHEARLLTGRKLFFTTENEAIGAVYREKFGLETTILPIPLAVSKPRRTNRSTVRFGFFGYSKSEKGFNLLPDVASICRDKGLDVTFTVQVHHAGREPDIIRTQRALGKLDNVRLIEGALTSEDYFAETSEADVVLLPYDPVLFNVRGSGIFTESVAAGRPIVASEGTFAAVSIKKGEAEGVIFAPYAAQACAEAIAKLLPRLSVYEARAAAKAEDFLRRHSADAYVDVLLGIAAREKHICAPAQ